jgi:hypothetical protein
MRKPVNLTPDHIRGPREFIEGLGLRWSGSRFQIYETTILQAMGMVPVDPSFFEENGGADGRRALIMEGGGQLFQLILAHEAFPHLDQQHLKRAQTRDRR